VQLRAHRWIALRPLVPWFLIGARVLAASVLAGGLLLGGVPDRWALVTVIVAFVSDYFDGVIARALGVVTPRLRQADSVVDTVFYLLLAATTWRLHPEALRPHALAVVVCLGTLAAWYLLDLFRWRAAAGYHSWTAKGFALTLGIWAVALFGFSRNDPWLVLAALAGTISNLEGMAISLALQRHQTDVRSLVHAFRLRR
jgi:CDP-diacylglycerol--glycerol-3-phosphate 3-phosphatidyltransferase